MNKNTDGLELLAILSLMCIGKKGILPNCVHVAICTSLIGKKGSHSLLAAAMKIHFQLLLHFDEGVV